MHYFSVQSSKHTQTHIVEALVSGSGILGPSSSLAVIGSEASGLTRQPGGWERSRGEKLPRVAVEENSQ